MLKKIVDRIFMRKEINLNHLKEIDKVHTLSTSLFSTVNRMLGNINFMKSSVKTNARAVDSEAKNLSTDKTALSELSSSKPKL